MDTEYTETIDPELNPYSAPQSKGVFTKAIGPDLRPVVDTVRLYIPGALLDFGLTYWIWFSLGQPDRVIRSADFMTLVVGVVMTLCLSLSLGASGGALLKIGFAGFHRRAPKSEYIHLMLWFWGAIICIKQASMYLIDDAVPASMALFYIANFLAPILMGIFLSSPKAT